MPMTPLDSAQEDGFRMPMTSVQGTPATKNEKSTVGFRMPMTEVQDFEMPPAPSSPPPNRGQRRAAAAQSKSPRLVKAAEDPWVKLGNKFRKPVSGVPSVNKDKSPEAEDSDKSGGGTYRQT